MELNRSAGPRPGVCIQPPSCGSETGAPILGSAAQFANARSWVLSSFLPSNRRSEPSGGTCREDGTEGQACSLRQRLRQVAPRSAAQRTHGRPPPVERLTRTARWTRASCRSATTATCPLTASSVTGRKARTKSGGFSPPHTAEERKSPATSGSSASLFPH